MSKSLTPASFIIVGLFFLNTLLLPAGLLYTTLLTPLFLLLLWKNGQVKSIIGYALVSLPFCYFYLSQGADHWAYLKSYLLFSSVVIFILWACFFLKKHAGLLNLYFQQIALYNTFLTAVALVGLCIPAMSEWFWNFVPIHPNIPIIPRLKLLVYEPSFYSLQLAPIFTYYFLSFVFEKENRYLLGTLLLGFSLMISLSFGVLGGLFIAIFLGFILNAVSLLWRRRIFFVTIYMLLIGSLFVFITLSYFPENLILARIEKIFLGHDTSANGRTWQAFLLAWKILGETNYFLGAGLGQVKIIGHDIIVDYYNYVGEWAEIVRIPNTMAETLATFGIIGVLVRIFTQVGLFFYTQVYKNYYRSILFFFAFLYQFTGSYLTNVYEYLIWLLVFLPIFPKFDK